MTPLPMLAFWIACARCDFFTPSHLLLTPAHGRSVQGSTWMDQRASAATPLKLMQQSSGEHALSAHLIVQRGCVEDAQVQT